MKRKLLFLPLALLLFVACNDDDTKPSYEAAKIFDVAYGPHARNRMDVYLPANRNEQTPFVVLIHGGAWTSGNKEDMRPFQDSLRARGIASMSMSYRYVNANTHYEELMEDVDRAVDLCAARAGEWHIRKDKYIISGASAGAHMSLLYGYKFYNEGRVGGLISLCGPTDFTDTVTLNYWATAGLGVVSTYLIGPAYVPGQPLDPKFSDVSPVTQVKPLPALLVHGTADVVVPYSQATTLRNKLQQQGVTHKLLTIPNAGHDLGLGNPATAQMIFNEFITWVNLYGN